MSTKLANPAPLGLMGFGMTTILLNIHNAGFSQSTQWFWRWYFYGGLSQVIVGIMCFKRGDTFGTTAFTSYGLFWLTLVGLIVMPHMGLPASPAPFMVGTWLCGGFSLALCSLVLYATQRRNKWYLVLWPSCLLCWLLVISLVASWLVLSQVLKASSVARALSTSLWHKYSIMNTAVLFCQSEKTCAASESARACCISQTFGNM